MSGITQRNGFDFRPHTTLGEAGAGTYVPTPAQLQAAALRLSMRTRLADDLQGLDAALVAGAYLDLTRADPRRQVMEPSIMTASGRYFHFEKPEEFDWNIEDIAHGLSNQCRYGGHSRVFFSIAQHSEIASRHAPPGFELEALLHDAHEAFVLDVMTPLKILIPQYRAIEDAAELAMRRHYGLPERITPEVKRIDLVMLATEKRDIMAEDDSNWSILDGVEPLDVRIQPQQPFVAKLRFVHRFIRLTRPEARSLEEVQTAAVEAGCSPDFARRVALLSYSDACDLPPQRPPEQTAFKGAR